MPLLAYTAQELTMWRISLGIGAVVMVNRTLDDIVGALPVIAQTANAKARGRG